MLNADDFVDSAGSESIVFRVSGQEFCVDITHVREIRSWTPATKLPHAPAYLRGVINLRGIVLPVVDLAERLGFEPSTEADRQVIIVVQLRQHMVGLIVDAVSDIIPVSLDQIQPMPDAATDAVKYFVCGLLEVEGRMIGVVEIDNVLEAQPSEAA